MSFLLAKLKRTKPFERSFRPVLARLCMRPASAQHCLAISMRSGWKTPFTRFTDKTITCRDELREAIRLTKARGYSVDDEERTVGMRCVAASIVNGYGEAVAGISVSGPTIRLPDVRVREIGQWILEAAAEVSRRLGAGHAI